MSRNPPPGRVAGTHPNLDAVRQDVPGTPKSGSTAATVRRIRRRRAVRAGVVIGVLAAVVLVAFTATLVVGERWYSIPDVVAVVTGHDVPGASFTVGRLRLPRAVLGAVTGFCFGLAGVAIQTMLRNPLASPDVIGISSGASAAAAFAIITLGLGGAAVSAFAIVAALGVALVVYLLAYRDGVAGTRLILIGIGVAAMLESVTAYVLSRAAQWDLQEATRWLTGSLNGADWEAVLPTVVALAVLGPVLLGQGRGLAALRLGDDAASAQGVRVERTRVLVIVAAVGLVAFATAASGPIAFVAFLSGPIAARLVGAGRSPLVPAGLVGAALVLTADLVGQNALGVRYPVGVVTGVLGSPYLVWLIIRTNRRGTSL